jgi:hypothetical protein
MAARPNISWKARAHHTRTIWLRVDNLAPYARDDNPAVIDIISYDIESGIDRSGGEAAQLEQIF